MKFIILMIAVFSVVVARNVQDSLETRRLVIPGWDVPQATVATWQNGRASLFDILFGTRPYALGWLGTNAPAPTAPPVNPATAIRPPVGSPGQPASTIANPPPVVTR